MFFFRFQTFFPGVGQSVIFRFSLVLAFAPLGADQSLRLQPVERWIERALLNGAARNLGDYLVVAVNTDRSVKFIKGANRPIQSQDERAELLAALSFVDAVVLFDEDNPLTIIRQVLPNVLVKGGDWTEDKIIGADVVKKAGGVVKSLPFEQGYATTAIIEKIGKQGE